MGTFTAGRIAGIPIRISPSWFAALALSTTLLGARVYPALLPATADSRRWALALATSLLFFLSILAHELGHSLVAQRFSVPVTSITLFLLGGASQIAQEVKRPRAELLIAAAGPMTSLVLGAAFLLPLLLGARDRGHPLVVMTLWLGMLNLTLGVFNLVPGFPMDGGRILRSAIWALGASFQTATRIACFGGRVVAIVCIVSGIAGVLGLRLLGVEIGAFGGVWMVLVGFYLDRSARQALAVQQILEHLGRYNAADLMLRDVPIVRAGAPIRDFLPELLALRECEAAFVAEYEDAADEDSGRMIGMVLRGQAILVPQRDHGRITAGDLMLPAGSMRPAAPDDDAAGLLQRLETEGLAAVPVVAEGEVLGLIGRAGLFRSAVERRGRR